MEAGRLRVSTTQPELLLFLVSKELYTESDCTKDSGTECNLKKKRVFVY